jgi:hypothetical protein
MLDKISIYFMRNMQFALINVMILTLLLSSHDLYSQQSSNDSLAIKLTDSINTPLQDTIRKRIIIFFKCNGLNPNEYYTTKNSRLIKSNDEGSVLLDKIGALRDLYRMNINNEWREGTAGKDGDEIWVIFDGEFKNIKRILITE